MQVAAIFHQQRQYKALFIPCYDISHPVILRKRCTHYADFVLLCLSHTFPTFAAACQHKHLYHHYQRQKTNTLFHNKIFFLMKPDLSKFAIHLHFVIIKAQPYIVKCIFLNQIKRHIKNRRISYRFSCPY